MNPPILVVEDDRKIANVVRVYLEEAGFRVVLAETGAAALAAAAANPPLLVILDIGLPDTSGEILCQELKEDTDLPVIFLTSRASEEERLAGFALGAEDYVVKPFSPRELVYRVKALLKRLKRDDPASALLLSFNDGSLTLDGHSFAISHHGEAVVLTPTEFKVLFTLASTPQKVFSREELVQKALGYQFEGYERSIDAHVKNIRHKLGDDSRTPLYIQTVYGVGYRFGGRRDG
jgi:two-component system OmpR family response regulator